MQDLLCEPYGPQSETTLLCPPVQLDTGLLSWDAVQQQPTVLQEVFYFLYAERTATDPSF